MKRNSKRIYYENLFSKIKYNLKATWREINKMLGKGKGKSSTSISNISINGQSTSDPVGIVEEFNKFFCSIGPKLAEAIPDIPGSPLNYLDGMAVRDSFYFFPTSTEEIAKILKTLKPSFATGHDSINSFLIKKYIHGLT